jgi:hypothetical protein
MADDATAAGSGSAQRRIGQSRRAAGAEKPAPAVRRRRRDGARRVDRIKLWRWLSALASALRRRVDRVLRCVMAPPRGRTVRLALPALESAADIAAMLDAITTAVRRGAITPAEAASLAEVADAYIRAIETSEFDRRLRALEAAHAAAP